MSVEDRLAVIEQVANYAYAWDVMDLETYVSIFMDEGVFEIDPKGEHAMVFEGRSAIGEWAGDRFSKRGGRRERHCPLGTVFLELTADTAKTRTVQISVRFEPGERPKVVGGGTYFDEWAKTAEGWQLSRRSLLHDHVF